MKTLGKVLYHRDAISMAVRSLYTVCGAHHESVAIGVLDGCLPLMDRLLSTWLHPHGVRYIRCKSYRGTKSFGNIEFDTLGFDLSVLRGRRVILVDDIIDSGFTSSAVVKKIREHGAGHITLLSLFKRSTTPEIPDVETTVSGFSIPNDAFIVGFGLDYNGSYRDLSDVYELVDQD